jgi:hypothetical protein
MLASLSSAQHHFRVLYIPDSPVYTAMQRYIYVSWSLTSFAISVAAGVVNHPADEDE